jgi:hypothetical protein
MTANAVKCAWLRADWKDSGEVSGPRPSSFALRGALAFRIGKPETHGSAAEFLAACDPEQPGCITLDVRITMIADMGISTY